MTNDEFIASVETLLRLNGWREHRPGRWHRAFCWYEVRVASHSFAIWKLPQSKYEGAFRCATGNKNHVEFPMTGGTVTGMKVLGVRAAAFDFATGSLLLPRQRRAKR